MLQKKLNKMKSPTLINRTNLLSKSNSLRKRHNGEEIDQLWIAETVSPFPVVLHTCSSDCLL